MIEQTPSIDSTSDNQTENLTPQEQKYGKSIFKKWIYAKFDAKLILEVVHKDIYYNPKLAILLPTLTPAGKKTFLSATLDLKGLKTLQKELSEAIKVVESHSKPIENDSQENVTHSH